MVPGFRVIHTVREGTHYSLVRAVRESDGARVILKAPQHDSRDPRAIARLQREYDLTRSLDPDAVLRAVGFDGQGTLVLEDAGGRPLDQEFSFQMKTGALVEVATKLAAALEAVHGRGVIHRNLKPENIFVEPAAGTVRLTDFGIATLGPEEVPPRRGEVLLQGSLPYMSPEQTGWMNRPIDFRSDLYSAGVMLYQMATGMLPFTGSDPLEWIHAHLARAPVPPERIVTGVPPALSAIILKLLSKNPEDRYQTAYGLRRDLEHAEGVAFPLGRNDAAARLRIPRRLYGREREVAELAGELEWVRSTGRARVVTVAGEAGIGKTSLVREIQKPLAALRGWFLAGKSDQYTQDVPYVALSAALGAFADELIGEPEESLAEWRKLLNRPEIRPVSSIARGLVPIAGKFSAAALDSAAAARERLAQAVSGLVAAVASRDGPVVLFLDDMQWSDLATLDLLDKILAEGQGKHPLLVVLAYRDTEVDPAHPLSVLLSVLRESGILRRELRLGGLPRESISRIVGETLGEPASRVAELSEVVARKTAGNPFFAGIFLRSLHEEGVLRFDAAAGRWRWSSEEIAAREVTENAVELVLRRMKILPEGTRALLPVAACVGAQAGAEILSLATGVAPGEIEVRLAPALESELLVAVRDGERVYRFQHDRIRQAAFALIGDAEVAVWDYRIGRSLESSGAGPVEVVDHLNRALELQKNSDERVRLARLNLEAGLRAQAGAAYQAASGYFGSGLAALRGFAEGADYETALALVLKKAESEYQAGDFAAAEEDLDRAERRARSTTDRARAYPLRVLLLTSRGEPDLAVKSGVSGLRMLGVEIPRRWRAVTRSPESLASLPPMTEPRWRLAHEILRNVASPAYFLDYRLALRVSVAAVRLVQRHGASGAATWSYNFYGAALGLIERDYSAGYRFGRIALALSERPENQMYRGAAHLGFGMLVSHWSRALDEGIAHLETAYRESRSAGSLSEAGYALNIILTKKFIAGEGLSALLERIEKYRPFILSTRYVELDDILLVIRRAAERLAGIEPPDGYSESLHLEEMKKERRIKTAVHRYHIFKAGFHYVMGDLAAAALEAAAAREMLGVSFGQIQEAEFYFYESLILAASGTDRLRLRTNLARLAEWSASSPAVFRPKFLLARAEMLRSENKANAALYEEAIRAAREYGFAPVEALANERAGDFHSAQGSFTGAVAYYREARRLYEGWGARAKVARLDRLRPELVPAAAPGTGTFFGTAAGVDLISVFKAAQRVSSEISLPRLAAELTDVMIQYAGAQKGILLLPRNGSYYPEIVAGEGGVEFPEPLVQRAARTGKPVLIQEPVSILCLPIKKAGHVTGVVYLENRIAPYVFDRDRISLLELLASQAAISIENARLFREIEAGVRFRDDFLKLVSHELRTPLTPLSLQLQVLRRRLARPETAGRPLSTLLSGAERQLKRLSYLVESLLDVATLQSGSQLEIRSEETDLAAIVRGAAEDATRLLSEPLDRVEIVGTENPRGSWSEDRLRQAVSYLIANALRFGAGHPVRVAFGLDANHLAYVTVTDEGPGIMPDDRERIFGPFERGVSVDAFGGLGIGLYLARGIAHAHGGTVELESEKGKGSSFTIRLPLAPPADRSGDERISATLRDRPAS